MIKSQDQIDEVKKTEDLLDSFNEMAKNSFDLGRERHRLYFEELKFIYDNKTAATDYILDLLRHLLAISVGGYIVLLVAPVELFRNISIAENILGVVIIFCIILITIFMVKKVRFGNKISSNLGALTDLADVIYSSEQKREKGYQEIKEKITNTTAR